MWTIPQTSFSLSLGSLLIFRPSLQPSFLQVLIAVIIRDENKLLYLTNMCFTWKLASPHSLILHDLALLTAPNHHFSSLLASTLHWLRGSTRRLLALLHNPHTWTPQTHTWTHKYLTFYTYTHLHLIHTHAYPSIPHTHITFIPQRRTHNSHAYTSHTHPSQTTHRLHSLTQIYTHLYLRHPLHIYTSNIHM